MGKGHNNCQVFLREHLHANDLNDPSFDKFIMQDVDSLLKDFPYKKQLDELLNLATRADQLVSGASYTVSIRKVKKPRTTNEISDELAEKIIHMINEHNKEEKKEVKSKKEEKKQVEPKNEEKKQVEQKEQKDKARHKFKIYETAEGFRVKDTTAKRWVGQRYRTEAEAIKELQKHSK